MLNAIDRKPHPTGRRARVRMERFKAAEQPASERKVFELVLAQSGLSTR
jgi:hypothetical protein